MANILYSKENDNHKKMQFNYVDINADLKGYINLDAICIIGEKQYSDWENMPNTDNFLNGLSLSLNMHANALIYQSDNMIYYGYPRVAIDVAQWAIKNPNTLQDVENWIDFVDECYNLENQDNEKYCSWKCNVEKQRFYKRMEYLKEQRMQRDYSNHRPFLDADKLNKLCIKLNNEYSKDV